MQRASFTNCAQDIMHVQTFASDNISQTSPTHLNASSMNMLAASPRLIGIVYQGIIPDQASSSIAQQSCGLKQLSCTTHEDQDNQLSHTGSHIPFIYFDIHTSFRMYTLSTLGNFCLWITSFWSSPFPSEFKSQSQFPSLFSVVSSLSHLNCMFALRLCSPLHFLLCTICAIASFAFLHHCVQFHCVLPSVLHV